MEAARPPVRAAVAVFVAALAMFGFVSAANAAPGDVFVADDEAQIVFKVGPSGGSPQPLAMSPEFSSPTGLALDPTTGLLILTDFDADIFTVDRSNGAVGILATVTGSSLSDVAIGPDGNYYVTDTNGTGSLLRIDRQTKAVSPIASNFTPGGSPYGLAIARDGTIYVSDQDESVYRVTPTGTVSPLANSPFLSGADGLALTPDGRTLFVGSFGSPDGNCCFPPNSVNKVDVASGAVTRLAEVEDSVAVSLRTDGSLLSSNVDSDQLEIVPASGSPVTTFTTAGTPFVYPHDTVIEPELCAGKIPTVVGTTGPDNLVGSPFADVVSTLGGKDMVKAGGGNDIVCGGPDKDKLFGQGGRDRLLGQGGKDRLNGGKKKDVVKGGGGRDRCTRGKGDKLRSC